jgi:hypothetical protein
MITNTGKNIIAKYLLGHTSSYASHIAVGCGAKSLDSIEDADDYADEFEVKETLDFEMFRVPITSRGFVKEDDVSYVVLTAELPTTERYGITEVGIFSAGSNPEAGVADSKVIKAFADLENWEQHQQTSVSAIPRLTSAIDDEENNINITEPFFRISSDNPTFLYDERILTNEVPRFLDSSIVARGDTSTIILNDEDVLIPDDTQSSHIHLTNVSLTLDENAPTDKLKFAFSLINRSGDEIPDEVRVVLQFASGEGNDIQYASMGIRLRDGINGVDFATNRYFVSTQEIQSLTKTIGFSWDQVTVIKAYASVIDNDLPSDQYYIAYDGLRLENTTDVHPLYGLTGYSVLKNENGIPIIKSSNSSSFIEFRFGFQLDQYSSGS